MFASYVMTPQDWTILIGIITTSVLTIWRAFVEWSDRHQKAEQDQERAKLLAEQEQERLEWEAKERAAEAEHRRKMEALQVAALRQGGLAAKEAKKAQEAAVLSAQAVTQKIEESIHERRDQVKDLKEKIEDNTKVNEEAIRTANGFNGKLVALGESINQPNKMS